MKKDARGVKKQLYGGWKTVSSICRPILWSGNRSVS